MLIGEKKMASGILSLAYMGELGVVFNLAYIELKKTRYLEFIRENIKNTTAKFTAPTIQDDAVVKQQQLILNKLRDMLSPNKRIRKQAWTHYKKGVVEDVEHFDFIAGWVYDFFDKEWDKLIAQFMLTASGIAVLAMTILGYSTSLSTLVNPDSIWRFLFYILFVTNIFPVLCILVGRRMRSRAKKCTDSFEEVMTDSFATGIESIINKNP